MRRNLVGKKKPQQPKIRWSDTFSLDAGSLTGVQLKALRDANSDLPRSFDTHWTEIADGSTNQFKKGDHMALSSAFLSQRSDTMTNPSVTFTPQLAGTIREERNRLGFLPAAGGNQVADFDTVADEGSGGSATNGTDYVLIGNSDKAMQLGFDLSGTYNYGAASVTVGTNDYFRIRFKIGSFGRFAGSDPAAEVHLRINGSVVTTLGAEADGVYTWYGRANGSTVDVVLRIPAYCQCRVYYMHVDLPSTTNTQLQRIDNETATSDDLLIGVRANGATALTTAYDVNAFYSGYQRGLYKDVLLSTSYNWGRSSDYRPGHEQEYVASIGNVTEDGWYGLPRLAFLPIEDVWAALYDYDSGIGSEVDPTAEWFIAHDIPFHNATNWDSQVHTDIIVSGLYNYYDAWIKESGVQQQTSVAAVAAPTWDDNWKRAHSDYHLFARNATGDPYTWEYQNFDSVDFADEPNDFTLEARGIVLGTQQFVELCDEADGSQVNISGTTPAFRGARGKIVTSGHDFTFLAAGDELTTSSGVGVSLSYINAPVEFEWRMITFIGESGQNVDITSSGMDTESTVPHWSHAGGVFGFVN